jgi:hypothetical protein
MTIDVNRDTTGAKILGIYNFFGDCRDSLKFIKTNGSVAWKLDQIRPNTVSVGQPIPNAVTESRD